MPSNPSHENILQELEQSREELRAVQKIAKLGTWSWEAATGQSRWSDQVYEIFKAPRREPSYEFARSFVSPEDLETWERSIQTAIKKREPFSIDYRAIRSDGKRIWVHSETRAISSDEGTFVGYQGTVQDISALKEVEEALRRSETELRRTLEATTDGIWTWNFKTNKLTFSEKYYTMLGYAPNEFLPSYENWLNLIHPDDREKTVPVASEYLETKPDIYENEFRLRNKSGEYRWIRSRGRVVERDKNGAALYMIGNHEDITKRKQAEEALRANEKLFRQLTENIREVFWVGSPDWNEIYYVSPTYERVWGLSCESLYHQPRSWLDAVHEDERKQIIEQIPEKLTDSSEIVFPEYRVVRPDGTVRWILARAFPIRNDHGEVYRVAGIAEDITDRRQIDASLKAIEWLIEGAPPKKQASAHDYDDLTELDTERTILDGVGSEVLNDIVQGYLELLDTSAAVYERNGDYAHGIFHSGWCRMLYAASRALCKTNNNAEALSSGKWLCHESCWEDASKVSIQTGKPVDVACRGGIRLYAVPIKANNRIIGAINFGYGDPPKNRLQLKEIAERYEVDPEALHDRGGEYETRPKFIIEIAKKRLESSARLIGALVESREAQEELQRERERLKVTLHSIGDGVITTGVDSKVVLINKVAEILTGWKQPDAVGRRIDQVFHIVNQHTRKRCENPVTKVLNTGGTVGLANDTLLVARDGTERVIADSGAPIVDSTGNTVGVVLVFRDVTEKIGLEKELHHAHKMEAIGTLAGGIAHEFNNVLGIIIGNTELATEDLEEGSPVLQNLSEIKSAGLRAKDVVRQLLTFSRKMDIIKEPVDPRIITKETLKLMRAAIPSSIEIHDALPADVDYVVADPTQIHQLLINLCNNATQAMSDEGGILTVELKNIVLDDEAATKHPDVDPGSYVCFTVKDTGPGIPSDILDKIFDPYYTTKEVGKGTGMGLAVVHGIVKGHSGAIEIKSTLGKGTAVSVYLPSGEKSVPQAETAKGVLPTGNEKILLVDDEPSIVKFCSDFLRTLGYSVTSETDPEEIVKRFQSDPHAYDLIITDMTMPKMTGDRLVRKLLNIRPDIPIVMCTGFSEKVSAETAQQMGVKKLLMKPFEGSDLAKTVRKVLDET